MKKLLTALILTVSAMVLAMNASAAQANRGYATDIIISEYVEGSSNNKAIEIYNGTGAPVDLSKYVLKKQSNGANDFTGPVVINRTLAHNATFILANSAATFAADTLIAFATNATLSFNGNDAVALYKTVDGTETMIDIVGPANDPAVWGADVTLVRNSSVTSPSATYSTTEWTTYPKDTFSYLGSHTMDTGSSDTPEITVAQTALGFGNVTVNTLSAAQKVMVYATNLTADINVTAPEGFKVSFDSTAANMANSVVLSQTAGVVDTTSVWVTFVPTIEQSYTGNLVFTSTDAVTRNVALSGVGEPVIPNPVVTLVTPGSLSFGNVYLNSMSQPKQVKVHGKNLTGDIVITTPAGFGIGTTDTDIELDSIITLNHTAGVVDTTSLYIRFAPAVAQNYFGNLSVVTAGLDPLALILEGSGIVSNGNYATDLIISEYVEGSSNNKALEIFNGTGAPVDLSKYALKKQNNGGGDFAGPVVINRTLAHNSTFVLANSLATFAADTLISYEANPTLSFNGNDAIGLFKTTGETEAMIDVVGIIGSADNWGKDLTMVRNGSVSSPSATYSVADWTVYPLDTFSYLSTHTMDILTSISASNKADKSFVVSAYPNPFNPSTTISFSVEKASLVKAVIYDAAGAQVAVINNSELNAGKHTFNWNAGGLNSGIYFLKVISGNVEAVNKLVLVK